MRRYTVRVEDLDYVLDVDEVAKDSYRVTTGDGQVVDVTMLRDEAIGGSIDSPGEIAASPDSSSHALGTGQLTSPLPGTILSVKVTTGTQVNRGDLLLVLEAMKMENEIRSTEDGFVKAIHVSVGDVVEHGTLLIEFGG